MIKTLFGNLSRKVWIAYFVPKGPFIKWQLLVRNFDLAFMDAKNSFDQANIRITNLVRSVDILTSNFMTTCGLVLNELLSLRGYKFYHLFKKDCNESISCCLFNSRLFDFLFGSISVVFQTLGNSIFEGAVRLRVTRYLTPFGQPRIDSSFGWSGICAWMSFVLTICSTIVYFCYFYFTSRAMAEMEKIEDQYDEREN